LIPRDPIMTTRRSARRTKTKLELLYLTISSIAWPRGTQSSSVSSTTCQLTTPTTKLKHHLCWKTYGP
jgi:hypothetical protein